MADNDFDALRALRNIVNVLGPSVPSSVTDEGARYEWDRALRYAREGVAAAQALTQQRDDAERRAATLSRMLEERTFPAAIELTESMVERGLRWYWPHDKEYADNQRDFMRRFLEAALAQPRDTPPSASSSAAAGAVDEALAEFSAVLEDYEYRSCYDEIKRARDTLATTLKAQREEIERLRESRERWRGMSAEFEHKMEEAKERAAIQKATGRPDEQ